MGNDDEHRRRFNEYFAARHDTVRRTAYLICGDWHWADDLTQTAFIRLAAGWHRIRDPEAIDAYVRTCLVRAYLSESRRVWRRRERPFADVPEAATDADATEAVTRRMTFALALRQVPARQRMTLVYRFFNGLDVAQTAAALDCSEGTVKSQTARGLATLRAVLGDATFTPAPVVPATEGRS